MASVRVSGAEGYAEAADELVQRYESISFADVHRSVLHLIPTVPGYVLDIGAGTGRDAAGFAAMGHRVLAVEPTAILRIRAAGLHPSPRIEWLDDSLPHLPHVMGRGEVFDIVMMTGVWMHLDEPQRQRAMPKVVRLVRKGGTMIISLRYGPVPTGRRMFAVSAEETVGLAEAGGLSLALKLENQPGRFGRTDVRWTHLAFLRCRKGRLPP
jgi:SAM-dependent methyltransferase